MVRHALRHNLRLSLVAAGLLLLQSCLGAGCAIEGNRTLTLDALGQRFVLEYEFQPNDEERDIEDDDIVRWLVDQLRLAAEKAKKEDNEGVITD